MKNQKLSGYLAALLLWTAASGLAWAEAAATSSTALRADLTDQMLRALAEAPAPLPQAASQPRNQPQPPATPVPGQRIVITARPTSATVALRQAGAPRPAANDAASTPSARRRGAATAKLPRPALPVRLTTAPATAAAPPPAPDPPRAAPPELAPELLRLLADNPATTATTAPRPERTEGPVRVNHAGAEELRRKLKLDGTRARMVVQFRSLYGPFKDPGELSQVNGITEEMAKGWDEMKVLLFD